MAAVLWSSLILLLLFLDQFTKHEAFLHLRHQDSIPPVSYTHLIPDLQGMYDRCCDQRSCACKESGSGDDLSFQTIRRMFYTAEYSEY